MQVCLPQLIISGQLQNKRFCQKMTNTDSGHSSVGFCKRFMKFLVNRLIQSFVGVGESIISSGYLIEAQRQKICTSLGVLYLHFYIYTAFGVLYFLHVYTFTLIHPVGSLGFLYYLMQRLIKPALLRSSCKRSFQWSLHHQPYSMPSGAVCWCLLWASEDMYWVCLGLTR